MAISRSDLTSVFTPKWQAAVSVAPERGMVATVTIYDPDSTSATFVPGVGMVTVPATPWYTGKARIQPLRSARQTEGTRIQAVLVSVPITGPFTGDVGIGFTMDVTDGGLLNEDNKTMVFTCTETMDSSNPVERTLYFDVNYQARNGSASI